jgi:hypothetical protein
MANLTFIQGQAWLRVQDSALGTGVWFKTGGDNGIILKNDEIDALIEDLQAHRAKGEQ